MGCNGQRLLPNKQVLHVARVIAETAACLQSANIGRAIFNVRQDTFNVIWTDKSPFQWLQPQSGCFVMSRSVRDVNFAGEKVSPSWVGEEWVS